jgi:hypothetical protein
MANRLVEAFKENYNLVGLAATFAASFATLDPRPALIGAVLETAYLLFTPDSQWYRDRLARRKEKEEAEKRAKMRDQLLPQLRPELQSRFSRLEQMRETISAQRNSDEIWFKELLAKLDYLLEKFLLFGNSEAQFRNYVRNVQAEIRGGTARAYEARRPERDRDRQKGRGHGPVNIPVRIEDGYAGGDVSNRDLARAIEEIHGRYAADITSLTHELETEQDPDTKAVLQKRADVLQRRQEFVGKIGKILSNLNHQLQLLEDTFGLINDQMLARSPEQILSDVDDVVFQTDTLTSALEEIAPYEQMLAKLSA